MQMGTVLSPTAPSLRAFAPEAMAEMTARGRTLLLVIDVQVDFAAPHGAMGQVGLDLSAGEAAIGRIERLIEAARDAGVAVGFARVVTRPETDTRALRLLHQRTGQNEAAAAICRAGTEGAAYHRVRPRPGDLEIVKTLYSCFVGTGLEATLRERAIDTLVVTGMTTDCCVESTVRDGFHRDFNLFVVADACADYDPAGHAASLAALGRSFAVVVDSDAVIAGWRHR